MVAETFVIISVMIIAVMGPSIVIAVLGHAIIKALARNPSSASRIFIAMAGMLVLVEAIAIIAILITFQLFSK